MGNWKHGFCMLRFGFPLMWNTGALEMFGVLTALGYKDPRMNETAALVESKKDDQGKWILEQTYKKKKLSKWVTLRAVFFP